MAFSGLFDLLFPPRCIYCRKVLRGGEDAACPACEAQLPRNERKRNGDFFSECVAPLRYEGKVREAHHRFKFKGATHYAPYFGKVLADCVRETLSGRYDCITWVPLSRERLRSRGYDQAALLAIAAATELGGEAVQLLKKTRDVQPQSETGSEEKRRANISGAYAVTEAELVAGKRILLIDDVVTTGSTMSECARILLMAGADEVLCAALATAG